jgi:hypothetical protein
MPDPRGAKRLLAVGCGVSFAKSKLKVPVQVKNYDDFEQGTNYPKSVEREVWFVKIEIPLELMDDIKEGSIDIAGQSIDLDELEDAYDSDLDKEGLKQEDKNAEGTEDNTLASDQQLGGAAPV